jgi:ubiquinone/menaquinone biosynthesis C-methylase UbiE
LEISNQGETMNGQDDRERFESQYRGQPPWDAGQPQPPFVAIADQLSGSLLDVGCGTGDNAILFASRGLHVVGIDFVELPLEVARQKAADQQADVEFMRADALNLLDWDRRFDHVIDCGLFHVFSDEQRIAYVDSLSHVVRRGGKIYLMCFSDREPGESGPRRISQQEIHAAFRDPWTVERIDETQFKINPQADPAHFSDGGPQAWFATIRRDK